MPRIVGPILWLNHRPDNIPASKWPDVPALRKLVHRFNTEKPHIPVRWEHKSKDPCGSLGHVAALNIVGRGDDLHLEAVLDMTPYGRARMQQARDLSPKCTFTAQNGERSVTLTEVSLVVFAGQNCTKWSHVVEPNPPTPVAPQRFKAGMDDGAIIMAASGHRVAPEKYRVISTNEPTAPRHAHTGETMSSVDGCGSGSGSASGMEAEVADIPVIASAPSDEALAVEMEAAASETNPVVLLRVAAQKLQESRTQLDAMHAELAVVKANLATEQARTQSLQQGVNEFQSRLPTAKDVPVTMMASGEPGPNGKRLIKAVRDNMQAQGAEPTDALCRSLSMLPEDAAGAIVMMATSAARAPEKHALGEASAYVRDEIMASMASLNKGPRVIKRARGDDDITGAAAGTTTQTVMKASGTNQGALHPQIQAQATKEAAAGLVRTMLSGARTAAEAEADKLCANMFARR